MKAYGQAIDSIFTQIKEVMPTQQTLLVVAVFTSLDSCARFCLLLFKTRPSNLSLAITISSIFFLGGGGWKKNKWMILHSGAKIGILFASGKNNIFRTSRASEIMFSTQEN